MARSKPANIKPVRFKARYIRPIIYADPGAGKTVLIGTGERTLILNADGKEGTDSAARFNSQAHEWEVKSYDDLTEAHRFLRRGGVKEYRWVWLDGVTLFQETGMDDVMKEMLRKRPDRDPDVPDKGEYLKNQIKLSAWIRDMRRLNINFGITAHVMRIEDEDGEVQYLPAIRGSQGALASKICGYFSIVGHLRPRADKKGGSKKTEWPGNIVFTVPHGTNAKFYGKDRYHALNGKMVNPTIPKIEAAVKAVMPKKDDEEAA